MDTDTFMRGDVSERGRRTPIVRRADCPQLHRPTKYKTGDELIGLRLPHRLPSSQLSMYNKAMNGQHEFDVVFEPQDEGGYTAYVPDLPGCVSEGDTLEDATTMIQEAMALYLDARRERGWALPKIEHRKLVPAA
jgi:predicted RNase H-like HicB family nuclease